MMGIMGKPKPPQDESVSNEELAAAVIESSRQVASAYNVARQRAKRFELLAALRRRLQRRRERL